MKAEATLADMAIRESLRPHGRVPKHFGDKIATARKFSLDKEASSFLADLSHASFTGEKSIANIEKVRQLARLPHQVVWFEYDMQAFRRRSLEAYDVLGPGGMELIPPEECALRMGWLMGQYSEQMFAATVFVHTLDDHNRDFTGMMPFIMGWTTDDSVPSIPSCLAPGSTSASALATGMLNWDSPSVRIGTARGFEKTDPKIGGECIEECIGELRVIWSLLAAVNDVPIGIKHVKPSKGYVARGRYRRFVEHSVISINLPKGRDAQTVARHAVEMSRKRAHQVRGHWRRDWRHYGERIWVKEHQRGDASLGFVTHDYAVKHEEEGHGRHH